MASKKKVNTEVRAVEPETLDAPWLAFDESAETLSSSIPIFEYNAMCVKRIEDVRQAIIYSNDGEV